jgi:hypothetical protein
LAVIVGTRKAMAIGVKSSRSDRRYTMLSQRLQRQQ